MKKFYKLFCIVSFQVCLGAGVFAQTSILKSKSYLDVASGEFITPAIIIIENGIIKDINPIQIPEGEIIDLGESTLLPGLIDMHTHVILDLSLITGGKMLAYTLPDYTLIGVKNAYKTLMAGFTTIRDVGSKGFASVALGKAILSGDIKGPDIFSAGHTIGITGGHADVTGFAPEIAEQDWKSGVADGADEVLKATRYQIKHGAKCIKISATAGVLSFEGPVGAQQYSSAEMAVIVEEAQRHGIRVAAHAHGRDGILAAVNAGVHSIEHGSVLDQEIIDQMKINGTYLVPTAYIPYSIDLSRLPPIMAKKGREVSAAAKTSYQLAYQEGVKFAFGTDAGVIPHGDNAKEFNILVNEIGMNPLEAIQTATLNAADLLGVYDRGEIKIGQKADIIGLLGNPLEEITLLEDIPFVMKSGKVEKNDF